MDVKPSESLLNLKNNELGGVGTTKRKELHGTVEVRALSGTWRDGSHGAVFHTCKIDFSCDNEIFSGFVLLTESKLDHDVSNAKMDLYLLDKMAKASALPSGELHLDSEQMKRAMRFHELLFNGLFGKLFLGSKATGTPREFLLQRGVDRLWNKDYKYLFLPFEYLDPGDRASWRINWKAVDACVTVVEFMKSCSWLTAELSERKNRTSRGSLKDTVENILNLADRSFPMENLKGTVVIAIHTGRIYCVLDVLIDTSAHSPFEITLDGTSSKYTTFADYFSKNYGIELLYPGQPLLLLKHTHNPHNLLSDSEATALRRKMLSDGISKKPQNHVHMPPELVVSVDIPISVLRAFYFIPSVMHRLESLMLACQLRNEIAFNLDKICVPSLLILEALTTQRCCEDFSSERLELLGDSVLKYSVSCHLFLKYPDKQEGELSANRQQAVCNATLHSLGTKCNLHGYMRDSPFEPRRWVAPGMLSVHPAPCSHGIDTSQVPLDGRYQTINEKIVLGKSCDKGHRWLVSKSIADCVEAVIGAYYVAGGLVASLHVMRWFGIEAELDLGYVDKAVVVASNRSFAQNIDDIRNLESKLGYDFSTKGLLVEAITHSTEETEKGGVRYCYERLEFLGDAVLDVLVTWYLYQNHADVDPGELTSLRSASVNNEKFAQVAVRRNLFQHLQHSSLLLAKQVTDYVNLITKEEDVKTLQGWKCPKALGDLVESIAGAILIDTKLQTEEVWRVFHPLLSPIVTPDNLELPPFCELIQLCDCLGYFFKEHCVNHNQVIFAELRLQLTDILLIGEGIGASKKAAKGEAAFHLLKDLEKRGISFARLAMKRRKRVSCDMKLSPLEIVPQKKQKVTQVPIEGAPVISAVNEAKGGPRSSLYGLCKRLQWPLPSFETIAHQSGSPVEFGEGSNKKKGSNSFMSKISLCIPDYGLMEAVGEQTADKKSSQDSAVLSLLLELEKNGKLVIGSELI